MRNYFSNLVYNFVHASILHCFPRKFNLPLLRMLVTVYQREHSLFFLPLLKNMKGM